jgi:hypothetical protein
MKTGTAVTHMMDPLLGIGHVSDQVDGHPELVVVEWIEEWPDHKITTTKTCHVDELKKVKVVVN